mmetsp:Transcript_6729/g.19338  ORF Transcript_6729/g.19338 Transcript_6729/m.19338 type:complete len:324 (+) Transcript_6729:2971-3942(+)
MHAYYRVHNRMVLPEAVRREHLDADAVVGAQGLAREPDGVLLRRRELRARGQRPDSHVQAAGVAPQHADDPLRGLRLQAVHALRDVHGGRAGLAAGGSELLGVGLVHRAAGAVVVRVVIRVVRGPIVIVIVVVAGARVVREQRLARVLLAEPRLAQALAESREPLALLGRGAAAVVAVVVAVVVVVVAVVKEPVASAGGPRRLRDLILAVLLRRRRVSVLGGRARGRVRLLAAALAARAAVAVAAVLLVRVSRRRRGAVEVGAALALRARLPLLLLRLAAPTPPRPQALPQVHGDRTRAQKLRLGLGLRLRLGAGVRLRAREF